MDKCKCGCGQPIIVTSKYYTPKYIRGHNTRGKHLVHSGSFKKGHTLNIGRTRPDLAGENNWSWRGDNVSYSALHRWVEKYNGKPEECVFCGDNTNIQWANKSGNYLRDLSDWLSLCIRCHRSYDKGRLR